MRVDVNSTQLYFDVEGPESASTGRSPSLTTVTVASNVERPISTRAGTDPVSLMFR